MIYTYGWMLCRELNQYIFLKGKWEKNNLSKLLDSHLINVPYLFNKDIVVSPFITIHFPQTHKISQLCLCLQWGLEQLMCILGEPYCWAELIREVFSEDTESWACHVWLRLMVIMHISVMLFVLLEGLILFV